MKELTVSAIEEGTVIDHIPTEMTFKVVDILDLHDTDKIISVAINLSSKKLGKKGIVKVGGKNLSEAEVNKIALIAPHATVNIVKNYEVIEKINVKIPNLIEGIVKCFNPKCVTNHEDITTKFYLISEDPLKIRCHYCERVMESSDIILI
jgi:aspartate carbamoyltransferase regulatory subunit